jgi:predicted transcriptional regulator
MTISEDSAKIVTPVDAISVAPVGRGAVNPAAMTIEQLARAMGLPAETIRRHVEDGAPASADGRINLIHYAAWLNKRLMTTESGEQGLVATKPEAKTDGD